MARTISTILAIKDNVTSKVKGMTREVGKFSASFGSTTQKAKETTQRVNSIKSKLKQNTKETRQVTKETKNFEKQLKKNTKEVEEINAETKRLRTLLKNSKELKKNSAEYKRIRNTIKENVARTKEINAESKRIKGSLKSNKDRIKEMNTESSKLKSNLKNIRTFKNLDASAKKTIYTLKKLGTTGVKSINNIINRALKLSATLATAIGSMAVVAIGKGIKTGFSEAMDLEGYKLQLETATKDTKKASDIMTYAIDLANKTPFEGGQLVEGAAKFEAMGMSAKKWLTLTGDMAAATNKDYDQAVEALIDAQTGELERLKEFGIKKQAIVDKANEMFKNHDVVNKKGQIVDQEKFNEALIALMQDRYTGGMEKQAKSLKGIFSTISGVMKSGLASIVGMNADGSVTKGSMFDILKQKAEELAKRFEKWQSDGTFENIGKKINEGISFASEKIATFINFLKKHKETIKGVAKGVLTFMAVFKGLGVLLKVIKILKKVWDFFQGIKMLLAVLGVTFNGWILLVVAGVALFIKHWDKIKEAIDKFAVWISPLFEWIGKIFDTLANAMMNLPSFLVQGIGLFFELSKKIYDGIINIMVNISMTVITKLNEISDFIAGCFVKIVESAKNLGTKIKTSIGNAVDEIRDKFQSRIEEIKGFVQDLKDKISNIKANVSVKMNTVKEKVSNLFGGSSGTVKGHATGTTYASGGLRMINERGSGEIIDLPNGSRVYPADQSRRMSRNLNFNVNVHIQGNVIGNEQYAEELGNVICKKVVMCIANS